MRTSESRFLNWETLRTGNVIVFGYTENNRFIDPLLSKYPFRLMATRGDRLRRIVNKQPLAGEPLEFAIYGATWSVEEKYAKQWGRHSLKFGGIYNRRGTGRFDVQNVAFTCANLSDFLSDIPNSIQATFGNNRYRGHSFEAGVFAQDDWRVNPDLVLNLGLLLGR